MAPLRRFRSESGQALVEFALVAPLLLILVIGGVEMARAWNVRQVLSNAARDAARLASLYNPAVDADSVRSTIAVALRAAALDDGLADVTIEGMDGDPGTAARVELAYPYRITVLRLLGGDGRGELTLRAASVMRNE